MSNSFELTRRGALASFGATAIISASPALAASGFSRMTSEKVTLVWPAYHRVGADTPREGDAVILRAEREPYMTPAIGAYSASGQKLGYVAPRKAERLLAALDRGARLDSSIAAQHAGPASGAHPAGWSVSTLTLTLAEPVALV